MAKVTSPLHSAEARGKLGDVVYSTYRGISTVRTRVTPVTQSSPAQVAQRALWLQATRAWSDLTPAQRNAWIAYADLHLLPDWTGLDRRITGQNWFVRCNYNRLILPDTILTDPPDRDNLWWFPYLDIYDTPGNVMAEWSVLPDYSGLNIYVSIWLSHYSSVGRKPRKEHALHHSVVGPDAQPVLLEATQTGAYGLWLQTIDGDTGAPGPWAHDTLYVA